MSVIDHSILLTVKSLSMPRPGIACHGIFREAFRSLFRRKKSSNGRDDDSDNSHNIQTLMDAIVCELTGQDKGTLCRKEAVDAKDAATAAAGAFTNPDIPVAKVQGVRALKSTEWLMRPQTGTELFVAVLSTEPVFVLSAYLLQGLKLKAHLSKDASQRPAVSLATPRYSHAVESVGKAIHLLESGLQGPLFLFDGALPLKERKSFLC